MSHQRIRLCVAGCVYSVPSFEGLPLQLTATSMNGWALITVMLLVILNSTDAILALKWLPLGDIKIICHLFNQCMYLTGMEGKFNK